MGESINLREYFEIFKRRKKVIILIMLICLAVGGFKAYKNYVSYVPVYSSTVTVRINTTKNLKTKKDEEGGNTYNQYTDPYSTYNISQNQNIATNYNSLASSPNVYNIVAGTLKISSSDIGSITATQRQTMTEFIDITVVSKNKEIAKKAAEQVPEAFNQELISMIGVDCVQVIYKPTNATLISRGLDLTLAKFAIVGIVLSIFMALLLECLDTKIVTPDDVVKYWDYQLIGTIPMDTGHGKGKNLKINKGGRKC